MTLDELGEAAGPILGRIDLDAIDGSQHILFLTDHEGEPVFRVWAIDAALGHIADLPGCSEMLLRPHPPGLVVRVAALVRASGGHLAEFGVSDVLIEDRRPTPRVVH